MINKDNLSTKKPNKAKILFTPFYIILNYISILFFGISLKTLYNPENHIKWVSASYRCIVIMTILFIIPNINLNTIKSVITIENIIYVLLILLASCLLFLVISAIFKR